MELTSENFSWELQCLSKLEEPVNASYAIVYNLKQPLGSTAPLDMLIKRSQNHIPDVISIESTAKRLEVYVKSPSSNSFSYVKTVRGVLDNSSGNELYAVSYPISQSHPNWEVIQFRYVSLIEPNCCIIHVKCTSETRDESSTDREVQDAGSNLSQMEEVHSMLESLVSSGGTATSSLSAEQEASTSQAGPQTGMSAALALSVAKMALQAPQTPVPPTSVHLAHLLRGLTGFPGASELPLQALSSLSLNATRMEAANPATVHEKKDDAPCSHAAAPTEQTCAVCSSRLSVVEHQLSAQVSQLEAVVSRLDSIESHLKSRLTQLDHFLDRISLAFGLQVGNQIHPS